ncbi:globin domain-containing protein [Sphingomonas mali]|jgi:nitric oxide dioxygenase|uniref:globin domain-containing protein n=1 Tax=Sphingomonas mali TaxID=40682 RepID=UPI00082BBC8C|nr:globin domain-containing protein [Sphingomonas mali]
MDPNQVNLVRDSFVQVLLDSDAAARLFYDRLFLLAPDTRPLFRNDMTEQGRHLISALAKIVTGLSSLDVMLPGLRKLAERHVGYGVEDRHYAVAGDALMHMITVHGGSTIDSATMQAWKSAYALVADVMIAASNDYRDLHDAA